VRACRLKAALELGRRAVDEPLGRGVKLDNAAAVDAYLRGRLVPLEEEQLHVIGLDNNNRLVREFEAARGTSNVVAAAPADVFRPLIREGAQRLILVHNHPSGDPEPSDADRELTARFLVAGAALGLQLLDHVILARDGRRSVLPTG
jgi:DNA repair protein RadC